MSHRLDPGLHAPGLHFGHLGLSPVPGAPTTVLAGVMTPAIPLFDSVWFQALVVFAMNTLLCGFSGGEPCPETASARYARSLRRVVRIEPVACRCRRRSAQR